MHQCVFVIHYAERPLFGLLQSPHYLMLLNFITAMKNSLCSLGSIISLSARRKAKPGHSLMCSLVIKGGPSSFCPCSCSFCSCYFCSCSQPRQPKHCILLIYRPGMSAGILFYSILCSSTKLSRSTDQFPFWST